MQHFQLQQCFSSVVLGVPLSCMMFPCSNTPDSNDQIIIKLCRSLITTHSFESGVLWHGKHQKHAGQRAPRTSTEEHWATAFSIVNAFQKGRHDQITWIWLPLCFLLSAYHCKFFWPQTRCSNCLLPSFSQSDESVSFSLTKDFAGNKSLLRNTNAHVMFPRNGSF